MQQAPRIHKVFHNPTSGQTVIGFTQIENDGMDRVESVLKTKDAPLPALLEALGALAPTITKLAELPSAYVDTVRGINLQRDAEEPETYTVMYCATKRISESHSPLVLNTPAVAPPSGALIQDVLDAAREFLDGNRAQADLPIEK